MEKTLAPLPVATKSERLTAALMHGASIFFPLIAPAIGYLIPGASSKYVRAHSVQAVLDVLVFKVISFVVFIISLIHTIVTAVGIYNSDGASFDWKALLAKIAILLGITAVLWIINLVLSLKQISQANRGVWPNGYFTKNLRSDAS